MQKILIFCFLFINTLCFSQNDLNSSFMSSLPQKGMINAAFMPNYKFVIGGDFSQGFYNSFGGVQTKDGKIIYENPKAQEFFYSNTNWNLLNVGIRLKSNSYLSVSQNLKSLNYVSITGSGMQLAAYGNAPFIGKKVSINPNLQLLNYSETSIGLAQKIGKFQVGAKLKVLNGITAVSTTKSDLSLYTDADVYQLTLASDYQVFTAPSQDVQSLIDNDSDLANKIQGHGFGFDLGAQFSLTDKITLAASVQDLGNIKWTGKDNSSKGQTTYSGVDATAMFTKKENVKLAVNLDTLVNQLNFKSVDDAKFTTDIPTSYNLSGTFQINSKLSASALVSSAQYHGQSSNAFLINGQYQLLPVLNVGLSYGMRNASSMLGANITIEKGIFQFFALSDNLLGLIKPLQASNVNGRLGLNLRFGKRD